MNPVELSATEARRLLLRAQGLLGADSQRRSTPVERVRALLRRLGAIQLDTISVLARSHELVPYSRLGAVGRHAVETALWGPGAQTFEYWGHAACVLPLEDWPWYAFKRQRFREERGRGHRVATDAARAEVLTRLRDLGPSTATELGGARRGDAGWWQWTPLKIAAEELLNEGAVICVARRGWRRVYDLPERVVPGSLLGEEPDDFTCRVHMLGEAAHHLGVGTLADLLDYSRMRSVRAMAAVERAGLVPVQVEGWPQPGYADRTTLEAIEDHGRRGRHRTTLLSPFDSLLWDRRRTLRHFAVAHRLEAYKTRQDRVHGYYAMPLLAAGRLRASVDPARQGTTLVARRVTVDRAAVTALAVALQLLAALR